MYTQMVILALYFFNVYFPDSQGLVYDLLGLVRFQRGDFWAGLVWHISILIFTTIQLHVTNLKSRGNKELTTNAYVL